MKTSVPALLGIAALLCACTTPPPPPPQPTGENNRPGELTIITNPSGANIQVNGQLVGQSPCTVRIPVIISNDKWVMKDNVTITALPTSDKSGHMLQTRYLDRFTAAPKRVAFEFYKPSTRAPGDDEEFSSEWDRITNGRSPELMNVH